MKQGLRPALFATVLCLGLSPAIGVAQGVRSLQPLLDKPDAWFSTTEAAGIVDTLLLYQRSSGGWPKNIDMGTALEPAKRAGVEDAKDLNDATIDNGATCTQIRLLARFVSTTRDARAQKATLDGIDYLLRAQYPAGGWPQYFPLRSNYSHNITYNDGAMIGVMRLLRDIGTGAEPYTFVNETRRAKARDAVARGLRVILASQVVVRGTRTVWCAQHDPETLAPAGARTYQHPSLSGSESVGIVEFLMEVPSPSPEVLAAVESAVAWFRTSTIEGLRVERRKVADAPNGVDVVATPDPAAPPVWARFYEIGTNRPIFSGRDGVVSTSLAEIEHERRNGYSWYGEYAAELLAKKYPGWKKGR